jgi:hypothetical protein
MKIRCSCGTKYEFEVTPEMWENPVKFVCSNCGLDSSEYVNQLVRQEIADNFPDAIPKAPAPPPAEAPRLKISHHEKPAEAPAAPAPANRLCQKHRGVPTTEKCFVCGKPICPKCMEEFGYVCSPFCANKADQLGLDVPVFAGQKFQVEKQFWRKTGLIAGSIGAAIVLFFGVWIWYAWFGSVPHNYFAVRFEDNDRAYSGKTFLVGQDQLVYLHGGTLARCDLKKKKQVWSQELITKEEVAAAAKAESDEEARAAATISRGDYFRRRSYEDIERDIRLAMQSALLLRVSGESIWVGNGTRLTRYDWETGRAVREITLPETGDEMIEKDNEILILGAQSVTHVSLATGDSTVEQFRPPNTNIVATAAGSRPLAGGLLDKSGRPLDPQKVAAESRNLTLPARIALPALVAGAQHQADIQAAADDGEEDFPARSRILPGGRLAGAGYFELVPGENTFVQFSKKLLERRITTRDAMKAAPKKSALEGDVNAVHTAEIANELLNEMTRNAGGGTVEEDDSLYEVTVRLPDSPDTAEWTGKVTGPPQLFVLKTVNVIAAGKSIIVLDKTNKKVWEASLTYRISGGEHELSSAFSGGKSEFGEGPCVEHGDTLYVCDEAMLSAFDLASGSARWRVPSVGIVGLFFDDENNIYVNTTSGSPDDIKYSRQVDINKQTDDILVKLEPKEGKTLWSIKPGGFISYLKGKFIYTTQSYDPNPTDEDVGSDLTSALFKPAYLRIARINPKNGRIMWEHYQDRCPVDIHFNDNSIELVFKREVQVLRYLTL